MSFLRGTTTRWSVACVVATTVSCTAAEVPPASLEELATRALATLEGTIDVPGLLEPVEVIRDEQGLPHIYAQSDEDLFFAQGYVVAQDRLWQLEMWRRWHEGRLAEIFGPEAIPYDARTRLMMFRGPWDDAEWTSYHPDAHRIFTAFASGINAFIEQNRENLPVEFQLTGLVPASWTAETVVLRWAQIGLSSVRGHGISELQLAMNVARFGAAEANRRAAPQPWDDLEVPHGLDVALITQEVLDAARLGDGDPFEPGELPRLEVLAQYAPFADAVRSASLVPPPVTSEGSNNWVMSGARTPSGVPILANDPHRRIEMPALRWFSHLVAPGWNVMGGSEPPFIGVNAGHNERMAWGFTFAGTDMVDVFVEELHPTDDGLVRYGEAWEPLRVIQEEIPVKGAAPHAVTLEFSRHGPVFFKDLANRRAYAAKSVVQEPGTAAYLGSFKLAQAPSCTDFFDRAMYWKVPTHNLICGDAEGNIALQVTGLTPDRDGWTGRLPVPGTGDYEWKGFRSDLPREYNPERGYIATANNNTTQPPGYTGRPVFYHSSRGVDVSRITRIHQLLGTGEKLSVQDHQRIQHDAYSLQAERDLPAFRGWTSQNPDVEWARALVAGWDGVLSAESVPGAIYVRWASAVDASARDAATPIADRRTLAEAGLGATLERLARDFGADRATWQYGRVHNSPLPHMFMAGFDLPTVLRPGGFETVNATGANFRRIVDLSNLDNSVWSNSPGQSGQPGSPFYENLRENLANGQYYPMLFSRAAVEGGARYRLTLRPGD